MTHADVEALAPAGMDRRFYAFLVDRLLAYLVYAGAAYASYHWLIEPGHLWAGVGAIAGTVLLVGLLISALVGVWGVTPANAMMGLRVLHVDTARSIGVGRAIWRALILGAATLPTMGFATAALAWTAVMDPSGQRRGWHDRQARSVVVDVRPVPVEVEPDVEPPSPLVNLTALRLVPASPTPPTHVPARRSRGIAKPLPPRLGPATPSQPAAGVSPRQGLGWPLVGAGPDEQTAAPATLGPKPAVPPPAVVPPGAALAPPAPTAPPAAPPSAPPVPPSAPSAPPAPSPPASSPPAAPPVDPSATVVAAARPAEPSRPRWRVAFDTGESFEVAGLTLVGRRPEARPGEPVKQLVTLPSSDMSLSKTHAQFQVVPDGALVVMDRGSTNGSLLLRAGVTKKLAGGRPQTLREGDRVRFGDREMTVTRVDPDH